MNIFSLKQYPYFMQWLAELGRSPSDVQSIGIASEPIKLVPSPDPFMQLYAPGLDFTATMTFTDETIVTRVGKWSDHEMVFLPLQEDQEEIQEERTDEYRE